jgi:hypothetical protein
MDGWREAGFASKYLCVRPRQPMPHTNPSIERNPEEKARIEMQKKVDKLEQQVRDALFARSTAHLGEHRVLKNAFTKFDADCSGYVDRHEFGKCLEYLGLHTENEGNQGLGGVPAEIVTSLFGRYDTDDSGEIEYDEVCESTCPNPPITILHPYS